MLTFQEKTALAVSLVEPLNELAISERAGKILCEKIVPITHADLMALSDAELAELQQLVNNAKLAKDINRRNREYDTIMQTGRPKHKIIC